MKIAIPSMGEKLDSFISVTLGRAPYIIIYDSTIGENDSIVNPGFQTQDGSGLKAAEIVIQNNSDALLTKEIGRKAYSVLQKEHIKIQLINSGGTVKSAVKKYLKSTEI
jgi:predicted Fe-Mo cluster-binding NifX family protein